MKVLITGTHFTPAQAVIAELKTEKEIEIVYLGRSNTREGDKSPSAESQIIPKLGVKFIPITTGRLQRVFTRHTIPSLLKIPWGFVQAFYYLMKERPTLIVSFGGYVAVPVAFAGWLLNIPIIIHEQTLISGLSNTISSWFATKIAVSFDPKQLPKAFGYSFDPNKIIVTGNPMREEVTNPSGQLASEYREVFTQAKQARLPVILITGGNQGSHTINEVVGQSLEELTKVACVIHQTGDSEFKDYEQLEKQRQDLTHPKRYYPTKWIEAGDMGLLFQMIDLCICRAGVNTLLELAFHQVPSLIIPYPFVQKDEQTKNAKFFSEQGLGTVLLQKNLTSESLLKETQLMIKDQKAFQKKAEGVKQLVIPDASKRLSLEILILIHQEENPL